MEGSERYTYSLPYHAHAGGSFPDKQKGRSSMQGRGAFNLAINCSFLTIFLFPFYLIFFFYFAMPFPLSCIKNDLFFLSIIYFCSLLVF